MAIKKSEIYGQIWAACDKLRGGVEPARYKDYILTLLFVKYVSDRYKSSDNWDIEVPEGGSFDNIVELKYKKNIGEGINIVIGRLAEVNELKGIIDIADFNSEELGSDKEAVDKLSGLVEIFQKPELDFTNNRAGGDDILGDAYEFLMRKFAQDSGKSKGQFYTPGEVSRIMAKVIGIRNAVDSSKTVYDPACGSGSLLIRAADEAPCDITIFGQEKDNATAGLARMNLVLHNRGAGEIAKGSTITSPKYKNENNPELLKTFDYIVVNPPFSDKSWMDGIVIPDTYGRYTETDYGVPPEKNGDYAWLLHVLKSLKSNGKAAIILPHGVLFRGNAEADIRKKIIDHGYIKGIIGLPANLFYGTGIPACIIVIEEVMAKRTAKNSVFLDLFQNKSYLLKLYKTLHPEDTIATEDSLTDVTITNVLTDNLYNDLGFIANNKLMILVEAQSTWTVNILVRVLLYLAQSYHEYFQRTCQDYYKSRKVKMPKPELYVILLETKGGNPIKYLYLKNFSRARI